MDKRNVESVRDRLDSTWLKTFVGLSLESALMKAEAEGRPVLVVRPDSILSADFRSGRLDVRVNDAGELLGLGAG